MTSVPAVSVKGVAAVPAATLASNTTSPSTPSSSTTNTTLSPATNPSANASPSASTDGLSETDFFQILSAELANQDPSSPTDSTEFITQMAQFSELSDLSSMQSDLQSLVQADQAQAAPILNGAALLGKTVTTAQGSGVVQGASIDQGTTYLTVSGQSTAVPLTDVTSITETPAAT